MILTVDIVSDADDVGAGAWLGSADRVADEVGLPVHGSAQPIG